MTEGQTTTATDENLIVEQNYLLKERFEIRFGEPLPELDSNGAKAYEVKDNINPQRRLFALICGHETSPRLSYLPYMKSIDVPNILKLIEYGIVTDQTEKETFEYAAPKYGGHSKVAWAMREAAHRVLYSVVHSAAMNGYEPNYLVYQGTTNK